MLDDEPATLVTPGRLRATQFGDYLVVERLGTGGMGSVDLAVHVPEGGVGRPVALKRLRADLCRDERFTSMFQDEVRIAARLSHPHVARLLDAGVHRGELYFTMDLLIGVPLSQLIKHLNASSNEALHARWPAILTRLIIDACEGLHAAHELCDETGQPLGVIHRDVSPDNLFVGFDGGVRVIDFGIASAHDRLTRTATGNVRGKIGYLAPERFQVPTTIDRRVDVWALGVVLWEGLALGSLFDQKNALDMLTAIRAGDIPPVTERRPGVPPEVIAVLEQALQTDAAERYPTARSMAVELTRAAIEVGWVAGLHDVAEWTNQLLPDAARRQERLAQMAARARRDTIDLELPEAEDEGATLVHPPDRIRPEADSFQPPASSWSDTDEVATRQQPPDRLAMPTLYLVLLLVASTGLGLLLGGLMWLVLG
ncbi:MAG: serine/threonine protein kinase [Sandaracinaceae bacterium]